MSTARLIPIETNECPFEFWEYGGDPDIPDEAMYKIYHDGSHHVATRVVPSVRKLKRRSKPVSEMDELFNSLYESGKQDELEGKAFKNFIMQGINEVFPEVADLEKYVDERMEKKRRNYWSRCKRFRRKAHLNKWNYFVTFTYDDDKQSERSFRKKLRRCLSNLYTRRGWKYMGVFERAPLTKRLHFHGIFYVPDGEMVGKIVEKQDYSTKQHKMQTRHENDFFEKAFGRNDFEELTEMELKKGQTINYILKYLEKSGERIVYSRGIPTEICRTVKGEDIITRMRDFVMKYVLFDDVIDWERDVMRYKRTYKQMTITDFCAMPMVS